jgi:single-strand DNA-binding protein
MQLNHHIGRTTKPVQFKLAGTKQTPIAYLTLAIGGVSQEEVSFISYVAFNKTAELLHQFVTDKGIVVEVMFNMRTNSFVDQKTGTKKYQTQNVISRFQVYDAKKDETQQNKAMTELVEHHEQVGHNDAPYDPFAGIE